MLLLFPSLVPPRVGDRGTGSAGSWHYRPAVTGLAQPAALRRRHLGAGRRRPWLVDHVPRFAGIALEVVELLRAVRALDVLPLLGAPAAQWYRRVAPLDGVVLESDAVVDGGVTPLHPRPHVFPL